MNPNLTIFNFQDQQVRFVGTPDRPEWIAADICAILDIKNSRDALNALENYQKGVANTDTLGGPQEMATVTEAGLYALLFKSRKAAAKEFQRWVFEEVLPTIRKTGSFGGKLPAAALPNPDQCPEFIALDIQFGPIVNDSHRAGLPGWHTPKEFLAQIGQEGMYQDLVFITFLDTKLFPTFKEEFGQKAPQYKGTRLYPPHYLDHIANWVQIFIDQDCCFLPKQQRTRQPKQQEASHA